MAGNSDFLKGCKTFKKETPKIHSESHIRNSGEGPDMKEYDPAKGHETGFPERKISNFQYQNWPIEEDIELEDSD